MRSLRISCKDLPVVSKTRGEGRMGKTLLLGSIFWLLLTFALFYLNPTIFEMRELFLGILEDIFVCMCISLKGRPLVFSR